MRRFAHRLALALGEFDVDALLARYPRRAWLDWLAYHELEPWGEDRADARSAIVASLIYNTNRGRGAQARRPKDFMAFTPRERGLSEEKRALFKSIMQGLPRADTDQS